MVCEYLGAGYSGLDWFFVLRLFSILFGLFVLMGALVVWSLRKSHGKGETESELGGIELSQEELDGLPKVEDLTSSDLLYAQVGFRFIYRKGGDEIIIGQIVLDPSVFHCEMASIPETTIEYYRVRIIPLASLAPETVF